MSLKDLSLWFPCLVLHLSDFGCTVMPASWNELGSFPAFLTVLDEFMYTWFYVFLKYLKEFTSQALWAWSFLYRRFSFYYKFNLLHAHGAILLLNFS